MNRAGKLLATGMRTFFFAVPLVFWLFGPYFLVIASPGLVLSLSRLDRSEPERNATAAFAPAVPTSPVASDAGEIRK